MKVQFITKLNTGNEAEYSNSGKSGVQMSAEFLSDMLNDYGKNFSIESIVSRALDNNCIDRLVTEFNPDIVIIEAYWVVPSKFNELLEIHPNIKWVIRNHSAMPFIAEEGIIIDWSMEYVKTKNVYLASNHQKTCDDLRDIMFNALLESGKVFFLPNFYPINLMKKSNNFFNSNFKKDGEFHVGCFGASRILKNQLIQAHAAIRYAKEIGRELFFHINDASTQITKNLDSLFENTENVNLVKHDWMGYGDFYNLCGQMDLGMQVSFSETFNIVAADFIANNIPVITSDQIDFVSRICRTDMTNASKILKTMRILLAINQYVPVTKLNQKILRETSEYHRNIWIRNLRILYES